MIVNCFNEPIENKEEEDRKTKRHLVKTLLQRPEFNHIDGAYDGDRLLFSTAEIPAVPELQPRAGFIRPSTR